MASPNSTSRAPQQKFKLNISNSSRSIRTEEIEIVTQIHIPEDGGWGWVVVMTSFLSISLLDGVVYTFGSMFSDVRDDLDADESLIALINSITFSMYFMLAPVASAIINKYGFRECTMIGSIISSFSLLCTYFSYTYPAVVCFYGVLNGFGACLINMATSLVVGFYFEKLRPVVLSISASGSSFGCMIMYSVNSYLVPLVGWRSITLLHSGMLAFIYFLGMTYKPLLPLFVRPTPESVYNAQVIKEDETSIQRALKTASNRSFPSVASVVRQGVPQIQSDTSPIEFRATKPGTSQKEVMKYTLSSQSDAVTPRQLLKVQSIASGDRDHRMEVTLDTTPPRKQGFWARLFHWPKQASEARPLYRDDVFYGGSASDLPVYKQSVSSAEKDRFPIEYHMAVTRAASAKDINETNKIFPTSMRRVLASMIDPSLLKRYSFLMLCTSSFFIYMGLLIPYTFLEERNKLEGMPKVHCSRILSFVALTNLVGRLVIGSLAYKISPIILYVLSVSVSGIGTMALNFSFSVYYQYTCAGIFGFFSASLVSMRSVIIVKLFGLENLTNGTGLALMFQGVGSLISTPLCSVLKKKFGYAVSFYTAGSFLVISGIIMAAVQGVVHRELYKERLRKRQVFTMSKM